MSLAARFWVYVKIGIFLPSPSIKHDGCHGFPMACHPFGSADLKI
jgi:hypothetical protein